MTKACPVRSSTGKSGEKEQDDRSPSQRLLELVQPRTLELFHTDDREPFITFSGERRATWPVESDELRIFLSGEYFKAEGKPISQAEMQSALAVLNARANFEGPVLPVAVRVAQHRDSIFLDLANERWEAVEITASGWGVVRNSPVKYRRNRGMSPLPTPVTGGDIRELRSIVNVATEDQWVLLVSWLVGALRPVGPYPILVLEGMHGTAKSFNTRLLKTLIDPCSTPLRSEPRNGQDLMIAARNGWVLAFDNFSGMPLWLSDALCRLATGGGFGTRRLYTDSSETLFSASRPVILNGITVGIVRGDLLDRSMILTLSPIDNQHRSTEAALTATLESIAARVLGALLDAVSVAMHRMPTLNMKSLPRMADFAQWGTAAELAFGWPEGTFLNAYVQNQRELNAIALESSPLFEPLKQLCADGGWEGTAHELLDQLNALQHDTNGWPKADHVLSGELRRLAPNLYNAGISATVSQTPGAHSKKLWRISRSEDGVGRVACVAGTSNGF